MTDTLPPPDPHGEIILFQTEDGRTNIEVRVVGDTVWLSIYQMAELFQRDRSVISKHISNIYDEGELTPSQTCAKFAQVQREGSNKVERQIDYFNLDVIISVGYRVKSHQGTQFRIWATQRLREYLIKGFTMDDERLKRAGGGNYFDELLTRIRDIRSSERVFWRKVLDIYSTSIDYDPKIDVSKQFFATVQNKMHWAAHGRTAAEIISERVDSKQPNMGLTSWSGPNPRRSDVGIAKNYLAHEELKALNMIVSAYLDFAELQAMNRRPMYMKDWIGKLDDFIRLTEREILTHAGKVSHGDAVKKAELEYDKFRATQDALPMPVDEDFERAVGEVKKIETKRGRSKTLPTAPSIPKKGKKK
ncbi:virulence RhuM family protein [Bdellovibrionota bacterium FG-1]